MKTLEHCFPPKLSQQLGQRCLRRAYEQCSHHDRLDPGIRFGSAVPRLYLSHEQSRQPYFRAWQLAWAFYSLHYVLDTFPSSPFAFFVSELFLVAMALCIFVSTRLMRASYRFRWYDAAVGAIGVTLAA